MKRKVRAVLLSFGGARQTPKRWLRLAIASVGNRGSMMARGGPQSQTALVVDCGIASIAAAVEAGGFEPRAGIDQLISVTRSGSAEGSAPGDADGAYRMRAMPPARQCRS